MLLLGLGTVLAAAGCSASSPDRTTPTAQSVVELAPPPAERCRKPDDATVEKAVVTATDGVRLVGAVWGDGPRGVVLLHQRGGNLCGWWDYATTLAQAGFHVLAIDFRSNAFSERGEVADLTRDAVGAVQWLEAAGARQVVLMGASMGATAAMVTVGRHPDLVSGLVTLSLPPDIDVTGGDDTGPATPEAAAPLIDVPLLMCWATSDSSAVDPQPFIDAAPSPDERVVTRDGAAHGWAMLADGPADVRPEVLAFLEQYAG